MEFQEKSPFLSLFLKVNVAYAFHVAWFMRSVDVILDSHDSFSILTCNIIMFFNSILNANVNMTFIATCTTKVDFERC